MIDQQYVARMQTMFERALAMKDGDVNAAIRLLSTTVDRAALGGRFYESRQHLLRQALEIEAGRAAL